MHFLHARKLWLHRYGIVLCWTSLMYTHAQKKLCLWHRRWWFRSAACHLPASFIGSQVITQCSLSLSCVFKLNSVLPSLISVCSCFSCSLICIMQQLGCAERPPRRRLVDIQEHQGWFLRHFRNSRNRQTQRNTATRTDVKDPTVATAPAVLFMAPPQDP